jgi:hypothetical protein
MAPKSSQRGGKGKGRGAGRLGGGGVAPGAGDDPLSAEVVEDMESVVGVLDGETAEGMNDSGDSAAATASMIAMLICACCGVSAKASWATPPRLRTQRWESLHGFKTA